MFEKATQGMSIYAKIAYTFMLAMAVLNPLAAGSLYYPTPTTISQFALYKMASFFVILGCVALFFALDVAFGERKIRWHSLMWWALGYGAVVIVSYALSIDKRVSLFGEYDRFIGLVPTLLLILFCFISMQLFRNNASMRLFMRVFVSTSVLLALYGILQALGIEFVKFSNMESLGHRSFSLYGNPNLYAGYLCFAVFFSAGLLVTEKHGGWKAFYWLALILNLAVTLTSMTRSIWLACVIVGPLFILFMIRQKVKTSQVDKVVAGSAVFAGLGFALSTLSRKNPDLNIWTRLTSMFNFQGSSSTRIEIWKTALRVIKEYPLFGAGPDTFGVSSSSLLTDKYVSLVGLEAMPDNAHCMPLQLAATVGIAGMLSYYAVLVYGCVVGFRFVWQNSEPKQRNARLMYASILCAVLAYSVNALVSVSPIEAMPYYWLCLAFLVAPTVREFDVSMPLVAVSSLIFSFFIFIGSFVFVGCFLGADHSYYLAATMQQGSAGQVAAYKKATQLNPFEADYETLYIDSLGGSYTSRISTLTKNDAYLLFYELDQSHKKFPHRFELGSVVSYYYTAMALNFKTPDMIKIAGSMNMSVLRKAPYDITALGDQAAIYQMLGEKNKVNSLRAKISSTGPDTNTKSNALALIDSVTPFQEK